LLYFNLKFTIIVDGLEVVLMDRGSNPAAPPLKFINKKEPAHLQVLFYLACRFATQIKTTAHEKPLFGGM